MVPYVSVCLGYAGVVVGCGGGFVRLFLVDGAGFGLGGGFVCFFWLVLVSVVAVVWFLFVSFWSRSVSAVSVCLGRFKCWSLGAKKAGASRIFFSLGQPVIVYRNPPPATACPLCTNTKNLCQINRPGHSLSFNCTLSPLIRRDCLPPFY